MKRYHAQGMHKPTSFLFMHLLRLLIVPFRCDHAPVAFTAFYFNELTINVQGIHFSHTHTQYFVSRAVEHFVYALATSEFQNEGGAVCTCKQ